MPTVHSQVVVGDDSGILTVFFMKKGEPDNAGGGALGGGASAARAIRIENLDLVKDVICPGSGPGV